MIKREIQFHASKFNIKLKWVLEPVCCKKQQKKFLTSYWFVELGTSEDSEWYKIDPGWSGESLGPSIIMQSSKD